MHLHVTASKALMFWGKTQKEPIKANELHYTRKKKIESLES